MEKEKELLDAIKGQIAEAQKGLASTEEVDGLKSQLNELSEKLGDNTEVEGLKGQLEELGLAVKALKEEGVQEAPVSFKDAIMKQLVDRPEEVAAVKNGEKQLVIKAPATMLTTTHLTGAANTLPQPQYLPGVNEVPSKVPFYMEFADVQSINSPTIVFVNEVTGEGDAAWTPEGGVKPLMDCDYESVICNAKKVAVVKKYSEEMIDDIEWMASEIDRNLRKALALKLEDGLINGDSGVDPNEVDGILKFAPAYIAATALSATIVDPNNFDAIEAAICQVINSSDGAYMPDVIFVNPVDACAMNLAKASDGHYVMPPFSDASGRIISGVRVVAKTKIAAGSFLLGDFSHSHVGIYKDAEVTLGWENDDFRKNLRTIIAEARVCHWVSANEFSAFVSDTFANVIADLLKP